MKKLCVFVLCCAFGLLVFISVNVPVTAQNATTSPVRLDRDKIAGLGLTAIPPDSYNRSPHPRQRLR